MIRFPVLVVSVLMLSAQWASAQDLSRYRGYELGQDVASIVERAGIRPVDARTLHERPARIQELEWRAPYGRAAGKSADPVQTTVFRFVDDQLYEVIVTYDPDLTEGLTNDDIIGSLSVTYGEPVLGRSRAAQRTAAADMPLDTFMVAKWENAGSSLTLLRSAYRPEYQLVLMSKALSALARTSIREAIRLDAVDAPKRELAQRKKDAADTLAADEKTRTTNRAGFKP